MTMRESFGSAQSLKDVETWLRDVSNTAEGPYLRPFTANADWRGARVFIVGTNPATPLRDEFESFDDYWNALTDDVARFETIYRSARGKGDSRTTRRVRELGSYLGMNALITNACPMPASSSSGIKDKRQMMRLGQQIFEALTQALRPKALVTHGAPARKLLSDAAGVIPESATIVHLPHLSGQGAPPGYTSERWTRELKEAAMRVRDCT